MGSFVTGQSKSYLVGLAALGGGTKAHVRTRPFASASMTPCGHCAEWNGAAPVTTVLASIPSTRSSWTKTEPRRKQSNCGRRPSMRMQSVREGPKRGKCTRSGVWIESWRGELARAGDVVPALGAGTPSAPAAAASLPGCPASALTSATADAPPPCGSLRRACRAKRMP
eukprot:scaffold159294_cov22-Tisochrysis_lutea.AAC.1